MADYESLLEFEESLRASVSNNHSLLTYNLELKIDSGRATKFELDETFDGLDQYTADDLLQLVQTYDFSSDYFTTCSKCGRLLYDGSKGSCCELFMESQHTLSLGLEKLYWLSFVNNPSRTLNSLPNYSEMLFLQQGIPSALRLLVWRKLMLIDCQHTQYNVPRSSKVIYTNFQHSYTASISKQISKDLLRTFPSVDFFKQEQTIRELSTILNVYANYDVELGYCQGLLFLVGTMHHHFRDPILTFHALSTIMELELELHNIFSTNHMSQTLNKWNAEFLQVLRQVDPELHDHMVPFVEFQVFLFQWWLSFVSSHTPDLSIVNRVMEFCMIQGWKVGMMKISLGILIVNKPILMSLSPGDEEVVYQHLLNEPKWGNIVNDVDMFFGELLMSWDDEVFLRLVDRDDVASIYSSPSKSHKRTPSVFDRLMGLTINTSTSSLSRDRSDSAHLYVNLADLNQLSLLVFLTKHENESIYSDLTSTHSDEPERGAFDFLKFKRTEDKHEKLRLENDQLRAENDQLREELAKLRAEFKALKAEQTY